MFDKNTPLSCPVHAAPDHPKVPEQKVGILIANLGTPDNYDYWSMRRYLGEFLSDKRVIDYPAYLWQPLLQLIILTSRPFRSGAAYKSIWNEDQCSKILFFPLYPHYAGATSATANDQFFRALMEEKWQPIARVVEPYFDDTAYIDALAQSVEKAYAEAENKPDVLVCSYHGVPKRYLMQGDPYHCQCQKTTRLLKERLGWADTDIVTTFQSKFGPEEWLKPYTVEEVARLAEEDGKKRIAVIAPAFSADCIETLEEINEEIKESFEEAGGEEFTYIPCLNDDDAHIDALTQIISRNLQGWL